MMAIQVGSVAKRPNDVWDRAGLPIFPGWFLSLMAIQVGSVTKGRMMYGIEQDRAGLLYSQNVHDGSWIPRLGWVRVVWICKKVEFFASEIFTIGRSWDGVKLVERDGQESETGIIERKLTPSYNYSINYERRCLCRKNGKR